MGKKKETPTQIEGREWYHKGCFIQEQDHPSVLKYLVFRDTVLQEIVGTTNSFKVAKVIAEVNEVKQPHLGLKSFMG